MFVIPVRVGLYICIETVEYVLAPYVTMKIFRIMLDVSMLYDYVVFLQGLFSFDVLKTELKSVLACLRLCHILLHVLICCLFL